MTTLDRRRRQLREMYGFDFPEDFFTFWAFARKLRPLEPLLALDSLGIQLVGPFEVLGGRFDQRTSRYSQLLHWRYYGDPPEFFTVLTGDTDGLHWGYFLDDPADPDGCIASYYARDAYELSADGNTLFEATRLHLEMLARDCDDYRQEDSEHAGEYEQQMVDLGRIRKVLMEFATGDRPETGSAYEETYPPEARRDQRVVAATREGMGVVAPGDTYRPLSWKDQTLWKNLRQEAMLAKALAEARAALKDGYPATALKLGKDLWALGGKKRMNHAYELLDAAYEGLRRPFLRKVLAVHRENRDLPSVDILENEENA